MDRETDVERKVIIETTPFGIERRGEKYFVRQMWWNKDIEEFDSAEEAQEGLERIARKAGALRKRYIKARS